MTVDLKLHGTMASVAFTHALTTGDLRAATKIAYDALFPSLAETERGIRPLRTALDGAYDSAALSSLLVALRHATTLAIDSANALDMVAFIAHRTRGAPYDSPRVPSVDLARQVAVTEVELRGAAQALVLYRRRVRLDCDRLEGAIAYLAEGWTLFDGTMETARAFDERVAAAGSGFADACATMAITAAILSA